MEAVVSAQELQDILTRSKFGVMDIGDNADKFRDAVSELRKNKTNILVGPKFVQSDGRVSQHVSFGEGHSAKSAISL